MKTSIAITALASLLASVGLAAPTPQTAPGGTPPHRANINGTTLYPYATSTYVVSSGAITYGTSYGLVQKATSNNGADITTLVTFDFPAWTAGRQCSFNFHLSSSATVTGTGQADVFTSLDNPRGSTTDWPQGNLRDQDLARIQAVLDDDATLVMGFGDNNPFPCPAGQRLTGELVPTGDDDEIQWNVYYEGPEINVE